LYLLTSSLDFFKACKVFNFSSTKLISVTNLSPNFYLK
jgi:hypothetical protein